LKMKRFCAALVTAALVCGLSLPASAASRSSFQDVTSETVAVHADVLRLMGVVSGVGDNRFNPDANLSRAEFCVMVTNFIGRGEEVSRYAARTIFSDVTGSHWARGYINLMASPVGESPAMIAGIGNGTFAPNQKVTVAQAITVLLRVLGYTNQETGFIWPESYMDYARSIGLLDGLSAGSNAVITRAQAARLFVNALGCPTRGGQSYYMGLGRVSENTIVLAVNVSADDGSSYGAIRTSLNGEAFLPASGPCNPYALQGKRGALVLNDRNEIVTFLPDDSNSITVTLSGSAQPAYLKGSDGTRYTMSSSTLIYTADRPQGQNYIEGYTSLRPGTQITLFTQAGKIVAVYASGSAQTGTSAVIVSDTPSEADFSRLTGGTQGYSILKNGQAITMKDMKPNDVVTFDQISNTLLVSDLRINAVYADAYPNAEAPRTVSAMGTSFEVLDSAWDNMDSVRIGETVSFLLTADGKVAGIRKPVHAVKATAIGLASEGGVELFLPNGGTISISGTFSSANAPVGKVVSITGCDAKGRLSVSPVSSQRIPGDFDPEKMTLGDRTVSSGVRIFDQVRDHITVPIDINAISGVVSSGNIKAFHTDTSGNVDCIILNNFTGNAFTYGMCTVTTDEYGDRYLSFDNGVDAGFSGLQTALEVENGAFSGVAMGGDGKPKLVIELSRLKNISPADFFEHQGSIYLEYAGKNYLVSDDVVCYKKVNKLWFTNETGSARLAACRAFSDNLSAYYDPFSQQIRVVTAD